MPLCSGITHRSRPLEVFKSEGTGANCQLYLRGPCRKLAQLFEGESQSSSFLCSLSDASDFHRFPAETSSIKGCFKSESSRPDGDFPAP